MSARYLSWAYTAPLTAEASPSPPVQRSVLVALASHADNSGYTWPGVALLCTDTGFGRVSVSRALTALAEQGFIVPVGRRSGGKRPTRWCLQPAAVDNPTAHVVSGLDVTNRSRQNTNRSRQNTNRSRDERDTAVTRKKPQVTTTRRSLKANEQDRAAALLRSWWERQQPRPQQPWPAAVKVVAKALRAGWTETELAQALDDIPTISGGALDYWRRRRHPNSNNALTDEQHDAIHQYRQRVDARRAKRKGRS